MSVFKRIYQVVQQIPKGRVASYSWVARKARVKDVRLIGWALHQNPDPQTIPCHRVVKKDGSLASSYAFGGPEKQKTLLLKEGIKFKNNQVRKEYFLKG